MNEQAKQEVETILGREVRVAYEDPAKQPETVVLKKVSLKMMRRYASIMDSMDETAEIALYTGRSEEWVDTLTPEAQNDLVEAGRDMNIKSFANFAQRATKFDARLRQMVPAIGQLADKAQAAVIASRSQAVSNT